MPLAISSQRLNNWYQTDPHDHSERVTMPIFFIGLGQSLGAKHVSTSRPSKCSIISSLFANGATKRWRRILHERVGGTSRRICRILRAKNRKNDLRMFNQYFNQNVTKKLDPALKTESLFEENNISYPLSRTKVKRSMPF